MFHVYILETPLDNPDLTWLFIEGSCQKKRKRKLSDYATADFILPLEDDALTWTKSAQTAELLLLLEVLYMKIPRDNDQLIINEHS